MITKYAVQVRLKGRQTWVQAKNNDTQLIFDTQEEADQVVIDYVEHVKQTVVEKINNGGVKAKLEKKPTVKEADYDIK
jgi:hypothetical protein